MGKLKLLFFTLLFVLSLNLSVFAGTIDNLQRLADQGDAKAQTQLGCIYLDGKGVNKDYGKAFDLFTKAANAGNSDAQYWLGIMYVEGWVPERGLGKFLTGGLDGLSQSTYMKDDRKAIQWFVKSAEQNNPNAQYVLGLLHYKGAGVEKNYDKAFEFFKLSANQGNQKAKEYLENEDLLKTVADIGNEEAQLILANKYYEKKDYQTAGYWYTRLAENKNPDAMCQLGNMYESGLGVNVDHNRAFSLYSEAAELGNTSAKANLGAMYYTGVGIGKDYNKAFYWTKEAAEQGNGFSEYLLGLMYVNGEGTAKDENEGLYWLNRSVEHGFDKAKEKIADINLEKSAQSGNKEDQYKLIKKYYDAGNYEKAIELMKSTAQKGNSKAQYMLALMYFRGDKTSGLEQNYTNAFYWLKKLAIEQNNDEAQYLLGVMYLRGMGVEKNYTNAVNWFTKSAKQGNDKAQYMLAYRYETGKGVQKDLSKAAYWYKESANQGNDEAQYMLGSMYANGRGVQKDNDKAMELYKKSAAQGNLKAQASVSKQEIQKDLPRIKELAQNGDANAQEKLAYLYANGIVVKKDPEKAKYWYQQAKIQREKASRAFWDFWWDLSEAGAKTQDEYNSIRRTRGFYRKYLGL